MVVITAGELDFIYWRFHRDDETIAKASRISKRICKFLREICDSEAHKGDAGDEYLHAPDICFTVCSMHAFLNGDSVPFFATNALRFSSRASYGANIAASMIFGVFGH